jgi:hypothetical protein
VRTRNQVNYELSQAIRAIQAAVNA